MNSSDKYLDQKRQLPDTNQAESCYIRVNNFKYPLNTPIHPEDSHSTLFPITVFKSCQNSQSFQILTNATGARDARW